MLRNPALIPPPSRLYPLKTLAFPILSRLIPPYPAFLKYPVPLQIYRDNADTIVGNCDTMLFLGGKERTTLKEISEILGKETIDSFNTSENWGKEISHGLNYQKLGKELMTQDEIATMDGGMCILQLRGVRPFFSKKYDITKHPRYKYLSDADKKNTFDVERYIRVQRKKKKHPSAVIAPEEPFDLYEIELSDEDADFTVAE